ncbi:MAG: HAMP domain-containing histidine kinase [Acaryochloridaceae cyanobacterium SU_2_1]|nr:HAMP domain-containing histidine kinase [Acaryochloridaceae cyanobacterium SU_2_1]
MNKWVLPTVSEAYCRSELEFGGWQNMQRVSLAQGEQQWHIAIATILSMLPDPAPHPLVSESSFPKQACIPETPPATPEISGIILAGPTPLLSDPTLLQRFPSWTFAGAQTSTFQLPPGDSPNSQTLTGQVVPLLPADPLTLEQFCVILLPKFSWVAILQRLSASQSRLQFSFIPDTLEQILQVLRSRIQLTCPHQLQTFNSLLEQFPVIEPDYRLILQFSRKFLQFSTHFGSYLTTSAPKSTPLALSLPAHVSYPNSAKPEQIQSSIQSSALEADSPDLDHSQGNDIALLKAIAHEVRTPLATIATFTQLLLNRSDLPGEVLKRLESIQRECRDQIDRFGLIFRAMELTNSEPPSIAQQLTSVSVQDVLQTNMPRWRQQASRRNLTINLEVPGQLPAITICDPGMLEQVLTGLMDRLSHSLPTGSQIEFQIALAGHQLKLEIRSHPPSQSQTATSPLERPMLKAVGSLLMLQPETGGLSLSLPVTKHLFAILGGKLTVRQDQQQGEVLTIFLPLGTEGAAY